MDKKSSFRKNYLFSIILIVVAAAVFGASFLFASKWQDDIDRMQSEYEIEQAAVRTEAERIRTEAENRIRIEVTGVDGSRKTHDDTEVSKIFSYVTTWRSAETYAKARSDLLADFSYLDVSSPFLTVFFPPADEFIIKDGSGSVVKNYLDDGRNSTYVSFASHVVSIDNGNYYYVGIVVTQSAGPAGGTSSGRIFVTYGVDQDGKVFDLTAYSSMI